MRSAPRGDRRLLWALALATGLPLTAVGAPNVALPAIAHELDASFAQQQWVVAVYAILLASLQFASGPIADRLGRRRTCLAGLLVFALASARGAGADRRHADRRARSAGRRRRARDHRRASR